MKINRHLLTDLRKHLSAKEMTLLIGPRQAGKTTLLKDMFPEYRYVSLEDPDQQQLAFRDPRSFLKQYDYKVIFDDLKI